jgi:hypothetical protein
MATLQENRGYSSRFIKFDGIVFVTVFLIALLTGTQMLGIDSDLGRHLTLGHYILDQRAVPTKDILSHTLAGHSRPPYEWLSQAAFAITDHLLGLDGVILFTASVIGLTSLLLYQHSNRRSASPFISLWLVFLAALASSIHWLPRPHIVTVLLLVIWIDKLEQLRKGEETRLFIFPAIMVVWANLHGGFVFGFLAWGAYLAGWLWDWMRHSATSQTGKYIFGAGIYSCAASILTPDLWRNWEAVLNNRSAYILSRTTETMPPILTEPAMFPFTLVILLTILLFAVNRKSLSASHVFLLFGLGLMSLLMARNIPLFAAASAPVLSELAQKYLARVNAWSRMEARFAGFGEPSRVSLIAALAPIFLATMFFTGYNRMTATSFFQFNQLVFPVQAADWLKANPQQGNMFNEFNWGGYLLYRLWPPQQVFLDSQSDFYGEPLIREYESMILAQGDWRRLLETYQVDWAIIPPNSPLAAELKRIGWLSVYEDETAVILVEKKEATYNTASIMMARNMNTR